MAKMWALVLLGLFAIAVQPSMSLRNSILDLTDKINADVPAFGLIVTSSSSEKALNQSGYFTIDSYIEMLGRKFAIGTILGAKVIYVNSANRPQLNVALTVQLMADKFNLRGLIHFGSAGGVNNSLSIGTVVAPGRIAHTGVWTWLKHGVSSANAQLEFKKFNVPQNGDNLLAGIEFSASEMYVDGKLQKDVFWVTPDERSLFLASKISGVVAGLKASSSDIYLKNYAFREFLWHAFKASTVDTTSSAVAMAAKSNGLPFIVFRGVSNTAGASDDSNSALANKNCVKAVKEYIRLSTIPREMYDEE